MKKYIKSFLEIILSILLTCVNFIREHSVFYTFLLFILSYVVGFYNVKFASKILAIGLFLLFGLWIDQLTEIWVKQLRKHLNRKEIGIGLLSIFILIVLYGLFGWGVLNSSKKQIIDFFSFIKGLEKIIGSFINLFGNILSFIDLNNNYISNNDFNNLILGIISFFIFIGFVDINPNSDLGEWVFNEERKLDILILFIVFLSQLIAFNIGGNKIKIGALFIFIVFFIYYIFRTLKYWLHFKKETEKRCLDYIEKQNKYYNEESDIIYEDKIIKFREKFFEENEIGQNKEKFLKKYKISLEIANKKDDNFYRKLISAFNGDKKILTTLISQIGEESEIARSLKKDISNKK